MQISACSGFGAPRITYGLERALAWLAPTPFDRTIHSALVSGGLDGGDTFWTQTILCLECKELMDAVTTVRRGFEQAEMELTGEIDEECSAFVVRVRCENDPAHRWREWNFPDVCPRCGGPMSQDPHIGMLWD